MRLVSVLNFNFDVVPAGGSNYFIRPLNFSLIRFAFAGIALWKNSICASSHWSFKVTGFFRYASISSFVL